MAGLYAGQPVKYEAQMTENVILISLAILPVIVRKDKFEKEPLRMLAKAFFFGCLSVIPAILIEQALQLGFFFMGGEYMSGFVTPTSTSTSTALSMRRLWHSASRESRT